MRSNHSQNSHIMAIPRPDLNSVPIFRKWLEHNFMPSYLTGQFLDFLIIHKRCTDMNSLLTFLTFFNASDVHDILGKTIYQEYRHELIELRVIWDFIQNVFPAFLPNLKGVPWSVFLNHREKVLEKFEQDTPPAIVFDKAYQPPSPAPSYHEVSPQISKNQPYTTPDALFSSGQTDDPNGYLPSNPSVDFIGGEISVLSSRSAGSRKSGRDPPSVAAPDPLPSVVSPDAPLPSVPPPTNERTDPMSHTLTRTDTPSNAGRSSFRPPFHPSLAVSSCSPNQNWSSLRARHHRMSDRQATSTYVPPPAITELSELTPVNSNPRRRVVDRGGVRQTQQDSYEQPSSLAGDPTAEKLYQTYRTPRPPHPHQQSGPPQQSGIAPPTPPAVPVTPENYYGNQKSYNPRPGQGEHTFNDERSMGSGTSRQSNKPSWVEPHHKAAKQRSKLTEKIKWNGHNNTFQIFQNAIEGHLLQVSAGYVLEKEFLTHYARDPTKYHYEQSYLRSSEVWELTAQSCHQIRTDTQYLFGILVAACREIDNKIMIRHSEDKNGIIAWMEMRKEYDYEGSKTLKIDDCTDVIYRTFKNDMTGGLAAYLDIFVVALNQLDILQGFDYADDHKKQLLLKNLKNAENIKHLTQNCRDNSSTWTFYQMVSYLQENSKTVEAFFLLPRSM